MSIQLKIGLGFVILIVLLTSATSYWAAQTLSISLEASDLEKLQGLREQVLQSLAAEQAALASISQQVSAALGVLDFSEAGLDEALSVAEQLKRHLTLDWIEVYREGIPLLHPSIRLRGPFLPARRWPVRLTAAGPLSGTSYLVAASRVPKRPLLVVVARRPGEIRIPFYALWDREGLLTHSPDCPPPADLREFEPGGVTFQRLHRGRFLRLRAEPLEPGGPFLMVGYEADMATLSRTGVNALMIRLALLEVGGLLVLGYFLGRRLFRPLRRLRKGIERVAEGHWQELPLEEEDFRSEGDEIGVLARSFNRMVRELRAAQERLLEVQNQLLQKEKMAVLGRFSANVAHEINNPLGTILVSAGLIQEAVRAGQPPDAGDLEAIVEETKRCRAIVESLLRYAHNRPPDLQPHCLPDLVTGLLHRLAGGAAWRGLTIETAPFPPVTVLADATGFSQVLRNLLDNARDAVATVENPRIRVTAGPAGPDAVRITVADNGPGLAGEVAAHLFEPLMTTKAQGTGLGLAICQSIVEGHGGRIWAERTADGWTAFHFTVRTTSPGSSPPGEEPAKGA
ncbi:MAG: periplasmic sensor signal transduction histidine kinase [Candidatus Ozemobacter sibiricus]|uniref:histidine kinase n=1 Tax=Candidatus Ozemobacter sibiricus TaxID=2268124 RepID=A0A367ZSA3_9BACT|nr:MAG: periplasmic sensor signal transduction histidine kinase [Candidatus Ozemobacter sibiricus]